MSYTIARPGQVNQSGDAVALFQKIVVPEVIAQFETISVTAGNHFVKTLTSGKSYAFPVLGGATAAYHTPGALLEGTGRNHNEKVVPIDGFLMCHDYIPSIDELMADYAVRDAYVQSYSQALAASLDQNVIREVILGARASSLVGGNGGSIVVNADFSKYAEATPTGTTESARAITLTQGILDAATKMDEKNIPDGDRFLLFRPSEYNCLFNNTNVINSMYGGVGSIADGKVLSIAGFTIKKSNNIPSTDLSGETFHAVDCTPTIGVAYWKYAVGTVKLTDMITSADWIADRDAWLIKCKIAAGHGWIRPEGCLELKVSS